MYDTNMFLTTRISYTKFNFAIFLHIYGFYCYFANLGFIVLFSGIFSHNEGNNQILLIIIVFTWLCF
jgi:hypothetical protein